MGAPVRYSEFFFLVTFDFRRLCSTHFITKILGTLVEKKRLLKIKKKIKWEGIWKFPCTLYKDYMEGNKKISVYLCKDNKERNMEISVYLYDDNGSDHGNFRVPFRR